MFIGTSDAFGAGGRRQSAILLRGGSGGVLLDCGATTGSGLSALGLQRDEIDAIVVSHFHGDHFGGVPLLILAARYEDRRKHALRIAGPRGIEARVRGLADSMGHPIRDSELTFPLIFEELPTGRELELGPARVRSFETRHSPDSMPHGLVIERDGRSIAYSGDTGWFDELPGCVAGADIFICECTYRSFDFEYHLNYDLLASNRERFDCGRMVLTHFGSEMVDRQADAAFEAADDGLTLRL